MSRDVELVDRTSGWTAWDAWFERFKVEWRESVARLAVILGAT